MNRGPSLLEPGLQRYAWGDTHFLASLYGLAEKGPLAEAWFGAHPALPCQARHRDGMMPLDRLIAEHGPSVLGKEIHAHFGDLPFLAKFLAAGKPLSIQVHPSRAQAEAGFRRENDAGIPLDAPTRSYRDPHPKPEILVALTPFSALVGFRPLDEIAKVLAETPEIADLLPPLAHDDGGVAAQHQGLRQLVSAYFALPDERVHPALLRWLERLARSAPPARTQARWILDSHALFSAPLGPDRGLFLVSLLNLVELAPWEALFLPAGVPHAYLRGVGLEVMAASDNVLRAGLTPKALNVRELLDVVSFRPEVPHVLRPARTPPHGPDATGSGAGDRYLTAAEEFELRRRRVGPQEPGRTWTTRGPELLLFVPDLVATSDGEPAWVPVAPPPGGVGSWLRLTCGGEMISLPPGGCCFVPDATAVALGAATVPGHLVRVRVPDVTAPVLFRGRSPQRLAFGTSGLRGLVTDITDLEAYVNTRGFLDVLVARGLLRAGEPVALAGDLRPSTDSPARSILRAVATAVRDGGFRVVYDGLIPTPALSAHGFREGWASIMVTGSHIPFDRNGIKFNRPDGEVLKSDEAPIVAAVERARRALYGEPADQSLFDDGGMFKAPPPPLPPVAPEARRLYVERYLSFFPRGALTGTRVVLFEHTAVGREVLAEILRGLGAEVFPMGRTETFVAIDTEAIPDERLVEMQALAREAVARFGPFDALVSTDGDSDRPMVFGADPDGTLTFLGGDALGILVADYLDADALAVPVTATDAIERHFSRDGVKDVKPVRTKVGSPFVIDAMARVEGARKVGWEANGGFLTFSPITREGRTLAPLPTRDAVLPITAVLHAARLRGCRLGELLASLPPRFARAGLLDQVPVTQGRALAASYDPGQPGLRSVTYAREGHALVVRWTDHDGHVALAEGRLAARLGEIHAAVERDFHAGLGFGALEHIDYLDGVRFTFAGGDVAHVRSSGNAPQLRIYALSSSDARARAIVDLALAPGGLFATLLARV